MHRLGQRITFKGIVRSIVVVATLAMVWVAAGAPFVAAY